MIVKTILSLISILHADSYLRIDRGLIEDYKIHSKKIELIISDNCNHCITQIKILKECMKPEDVVIFMDNQSSLSELKLKNLVKRKQIDYPVYLITKETREKLKYKGITPMIHINTKNGNENYTGIIQCDYLKLNL